MCAENSILQILTLREIYNTGKVGLLIFDNEGSILVLTTIVLQVEDFFKRITLGAVCISIALAVYKPVWVVHLNIRTCGTFFLGNEFLKIYSLGIIRILCDYIVVTGNLWHTFFNVNSLQQAVAETESDVTVNLRFKLVVCITATQPNRVSNTGL